MRLETQFVPLYVITQLKMLYETFLSQGRWDGSGM
jgi:hypothetical protein